MKSLICHKTVVSKNEFKNNTEVESIDVTDAYLVQSGGAFENCINLKEVSFGRDITRIGHLSFNNCINLKDVWFLIIDENKIIEIAEDAFNGCEKQITFHIFGNAINNNHLNEYAKRHNFRVESMM